MYKIGIIGSSSLDRVNSFIRKKATIIGSLLAQNNYIVLTGGGRGISYETAKGVKDKGGVVLGISPASNLREHVNKYKLPTKYFDALIFTGFSYNGRNVILVRSCDALICLDGGIGTLNEITIGIDEGKHIVILDVGKMSKYIKRLQKDEMFHPKGKIVYTKKPEEIIEKLSLLFPK